MNINSVYKRISALCKGAARVLYDTIDGYIYISEEHTVYKLPETAEAKQIFEALFEARSATGRHGMDHINEKTAFNCFSRTYKEAAPIHFNVSEKITAEVLTFSGKLKAGWRFLDDPTTGAFRAVNTKYLDIFAGFEYTAAAEETRSNMPFFVSVPDEDISALILPFTMDRAQAEAAIKKAAELAEADAGKIKGVYFDGGIYSAFITGGRKDQRTAEKIIKYLGGIHNWTADQIAEAVKNPSFIASAKKNLVNVTAELKTRDNGAQYYIFYDKKTFFRSEDLIYTKIDGGFFTFIYGTARDGIKAAVDQEPTTAAPAEVKTETAEAEKEPAPAEAAEVMPAEDIPATAEPAEDQESAAEPAAEEPAEAETTRDMPSGDDEILSSLKARRARLINAVVALDPEADAGIIASLKTDLAAVEVEIIERAEAAADEKSTTPEPETVARVLAAISEAADTNASAIIKAGIAAEAFTNAELVDFIEKNILPPSVHTFRGWMSAGYTVKKGEKALFKADIWQKIHGHFYKRSAAFFGLSQVEKSAEA